MVSLARHFVPNPVLLKRTDPRIKCQCPLFLHTRYNALGKGLTTKNPLGHVTTSVYDELGRELSTINPLGYRTQDEARRAMFEYIEMCYNRIRCHSTLGYLSPADFELAA